MRLHENRQLFKDAIISASQPVGDGGLGISPLFIEKDYWISRALKFMAESDNEGRAVFKGGTSLSKAYGIGARFSEDIDVAISDAWNLSGNQLKKLISATEHNMSRELKEIIIPGKTSKGSHYRKSYYQYPQVVDSSATSAINPGQILIEINSFANPYPSERRKIQSFLTTFLQQSSNNQLIEEYEMDAFTVPVLDKRRTLTEKLVALVRSSLANEYSQLLQEKIRHFYDLHHLFQDEEIKVYLHSPEFPDEFHDLLVHDQEEFDKPEGWQARNLSESPLLSSLNDVWEKLAPTYRSELSSLAYDDIPSSAQIYESIQKILSLI